MILTAATFIVIQATPITPLEKLSLLAVMAVAVIAAVRIAVARRERRRFHNDREPEYSPLQLYRTGAQKPLDIVAGPQPGRPPAQPVPAQPAPAQSVSAHRAPAQPVSAHRAPEQPVSAQPAPAQPVSAQPAPAQHIVREPPRAPVAGPAGVASNGSSPYAPAPGEGEVVDTGAVRFHRAAEGTLQLLPGRLEIVGGSEEREEVRFVRLSGRDPAFTFGRAAGEPHIHVQLHSPTVSRLHARMRCEDGSWLLSNLSTTNPVVVNGAPMSNGRELPLQDGDRVEMGEIVFQFRSR
jgi:hypothetical protein